jgi:putative transposase
MMIEKNNSSLSIRFQCKLIDLNRSSYYYQGQGLRSGDQALLNELDEVYLKHPFYGSRRLKEELNRRGYHVGRGRVRRLMRILGIEAIYPKPALSLSDKEHKIYPYLLKNVEFDRPDKVWAADITYIRLRQGFVYLEAIIDLYSRFILSWRLSNTLEADFCVEALNEALSKATPEYFNTDQGTQFTSTRFIEVLKSNEIKISMDGRGRMLDNIFIERFWRSLKYEEVYIKSYENVRECRKSLNEYMNFYNQKRLHQSLNYLTPCEVYRGVGSKLEEEGDALKSAA